MTIDLYLPIVCTLGALVIVQTPAEHRDLVYRLAGPCIRLNNLAPNWVPCQASLGKSNKWHIPLTKPRAASLSYLCMLLLALAADVQTNYGPTDYPYGKCALEVYDSDPAIECDECGKRYHIQCQAFGQDVYNNLVNTDRSFSWVCSKCEGHLFQIHHSLHLPLMFQ